VQNLSPTVVKLVTGVVVIGAYVAAHFAPEYRTELLTVATGLFGWQFLPRHGDVAVAGVNIDDLPGAKS
jgi:hypothetical protein